MTRARAALIVGAITAIGACGGAAPHETDPASPRPVAAAGVSTAPPPPPTAPPPAAVAPSPPLAPAAADRRYAALPAGARFVMAFDMARLRASPSFAARYEHDVREWFGDILGELTTECHIDPLASIDHILMAGTDPAMSDRVVVIRGLETAAVATCLEQVAAVARRQGDPRGVARFDGGIELTTTGAPALRIGFFDERTLILVRRGAASASRAELARVTGVAVGEGLAADPAAMRVIDDARAGSVGWIVMAGATTGYVAVDAGEQLEGRAVHFDVTLDDTAAATAAGKLQATLVSASGDPETEVVVRTERVPGATIFRFWMPPVSLASLIERAAQGKIGR